MTTTPALSGREEVQISVETAIGGTSGTLKVVPVASGSFSAEEHFENVRDMGRRGPDVMDFRSGRGVGWSEISWDGIVDEGNATANTVVGTLLDNLLSCGGRSSVARIGTTAAYDHRLRLGTTKEYIRVRHRSFAQSSIDRQFIDCRVSEMSFRWNAGEGAVEYSVTLVGQSPSAITVATVTDHSGDHFMGWQGVVALPSGAVTRLISGEFTITRAIERFYGAQNQRTYADIYLGPIEATCAMVLDYNVVTDIEDFRAFSGDATETAANQGEVSVQFNSGNTDGGDAEGSEDTNSRRFAIGFPNASLGDAPAVLDNSNTNVRLGLTARAMYQAATGGADGIFTSTGNAATTDLTSPIEIQFVTTFATAY